MRSEDGGCNWTRTYELPEETFDAATLVKPKVRSGIVALASSASEQKGFRVYALIQDRLDPLQAKLKPRILRSDDGAKHWEQVGNGLPGRVALRFDDHAAAHVA